MLPNTIILGGSGNGKSSSIKGLDPMKTAILNTERKALPFKGGRKFKYNVPIGTLKEFKEAFDKVMASKELKYIVVESFTSLVEMIHTHATMSASGYDVWRIYNEEIGKILHKSKTSPDKYIFFISIDQVIESPDGIAERYVAVQGNGWKKLIEKEFVNVLYATTRAKEDGTLEYIFKTNKCQGYENISIKSPVDMFPLDIPNDLGKVVEYMEKYYEDEEEDEPQSSND